jgi:peroxiredoxin
MQLVELTKMWREFGDKGISIVAISVDSPEDNRDFRGKWGITLPLLSDVDMTVISAYGLAMEGNDIAVPATFIIDSKQIIRWQHVSETQMDRPDADEVLKLAGEAVE